MLTIGVLALQGAFHAHVQMIRRLGYEAIELRTAEQLSQCSGLIIPGGESTTMSILIHKNNLFQSLQQFACHKPIFGTCAGAILLSSTVLGADFPLLKNIQMTIQRNAYGRQIDSFATDLQIKEVAVPAIFIRAPQIVEIGPEVEVLATHNNQPVLVRQGMHLAATFHPELTDSTSIHQLFIDNILLSKNSLYVKTL